MLVCCSQILKVHIINVEEYEKQENFFIILEEPKWLKRGISGKCVYVCVFLCPFAREWGQHSDQRDLGLCEEINKDQLNTSQLITAPTSKV